MLDEFRRANDFTWDRANGIVFDDVIVNQGDANGRKMRVQVVNRGAIENLTGASLNLAWKATNGKGLDSFKAINAAQGIFEISFTKGMLANVGRINASLQLILPSGDGIVEGRPFVISNQASLVDQDSAQSTDSWTALEEALANIGGGGGGGGGSYDDTAVKAHMGNTSNPHNVTKGQVGLGNVDNTRDADKPVSTAMQSALNNKVDKSQVLTNVPTNAKFTDTTYTAGTGIAITSNVISATGIGGIDDAALKSFKDFTVSITDFGAKYDDPSFDNMPIIALAQEYVVANGGGTIYFPDYGTLYVKPLLRMQTGVNLLGANSRPVIKVAPDVTNFYGLFLIENVNHVKISNLTIDSNKENRSNYDITVLPQILISLAEAEYVDVEHNTLIGNGVWTYACFTGGETQHSRHLKLNHNHIVWKAGLATDKVGPSSQVDVDNTTIYFDAIDYEVIGNYIETKDGVKNMTCIEQHGANAILRDNYIDGFRTGLIVWSIVANTPNVSHVKDNNLNVINNAFVNVETGITNGATSNITYGDFNLTNVKIHGNKILLDSGRFDRPSSRGIEIYLRTEGTTLVGRNIEIENNIIDSLPSSRAFADPTAVYNFTGISVLAGRLSGIKVKNNTIRNIHGIGLMVGGGFPEKLFLSDSVIEDNIFIDCGKGGNITFDGFQHRTGITVQRNANSVLERVHIGRNFIYDTKPSGTYLTRAANGLIAIDEDQIVMSKTREQWTGSFKGDVRVQADISNLYINTGEKWDVTLTKDKCKVSAYLYISKTYTGQGLYVHLPYEANITEDSALGRYTHYKATGEVVTGAFRIYKTGKKVAHLMYPKLNATDLKVGDNLQIEIEYPVTVLQKYLV